MQANIYDCTQLVYDIVIIIVVRIAVGREQGGVSICTIIIITRSSSWIIFYRLLVLRSEPG